MLNCQNGIDTRYMKHFGDEDETSGKESLFSFRQSVLVNQGESHFPLLISLLIKEVEVLLQR